MGTDTMTDKKPTPDPRGYTGLWVKDNGETELANPGPRFEVKFSFGEKVGFDSELEAFIAMEEFRAQLVEDVAERIRRGLDTTEPTPPPTIGRRKRRFHRRWTHGASFRMIHERTNSADEIRANIGRPKDDESESGNDQ